MVAHILGFPRLGIKREYKKALEAYWRGDITIQTLQEKGCQIKQCNWAMQKAAGLDFVTIGDFSWYDHVLDTSVMVGAVPPRFANQPDIGLDTYFRMARGRSSLSSSANASSDVKACEMTKWFDTNYHYIVPEFYPNQLFRLSADKLLAEITHARDLGYRVKPVILGPVSYLWLGKEKINYNSGYFERLQLLDNLVFVYKQLLHELHENGVEWVQLDEPVLVMDLAPEWKQAFESAYSQLSFCQIKILLTTYFAGLGDSLTMAVNLPVEGLHIDVVRAPQQLQTIADRLPPYKVLSLGIVDGRNIWRNDYAQSLGLLKPLQSLGERLWIGSSCSLLHCPVDLESEDSLDPALYHSLSFAKQKLKEIKMLSNILEQGEERFSCEFNDNKLVHQSRRQSRSIHKPDVKKRLNNISLAMLTRDEDYIQRVKIQERELNLPLFPTTTIGSFPQTKTIRQKRREYKSGLLSYNEYTQFLKSEINRVICYQEKIGLDVLVHGEPERNDMVEYFGELLEGVAITNYGWVQSYGSRCVKPPIIFADVKRNHAMTVEWARYAQSLASKPVKGMLTGPVTILQWSFVRNDQAREETCKQIALALRDEVDELQQAGILIIQIDEPALREGLPLQIKDRGHYIDWAVNCFRLSASVAKDGTQIHSHMCYSEFNDFLHAIIAMDVDVITIETSRSDMELLDMFAEIEYPNEIGPGVYDIHSPRIPDKDEIIHLINKAQEHIPARRLWINPDCGLKTRTWSETKKALENMVSAACTLRADLSNVVVGK